MPTASEVLGGDDGRGVDAPEFREFDATLLEDNFTVFPVGLHHVAILPVDLVVRMYTFGGVDAIDGDSSSGSGGVAGRCRSVGHDIAFLFRLTATQLKAEKVSLFLIRSHRVRLWHLEWNAKR